MLTQHGLHPGTAAARPPPASAPPPSARLNLTPPPLRAAVNPTRRQAIGALLLYRREVSEKVLVRFQNLQGDVEADVYSMSPRKRSKHFAHSKEQHAQKRRPRRNCLGVPILADRSTFVQACPLPFPTIRARRRR